MRKHRIILHLLIELWGFNLTILLAGRGAALSRSWGRHPDYSGECVTVQLPWRQPQRHDRQHAQQQAHEHQHENDRH